MLFSVNVPLGKSYVKTYNQWCFFFSCYVYVSLYARILVNSILNFLAKARKGN
jgi:hypothetical protein